MENIKITRLYQYLMSLENNELTNDEAQREVDYVEILTWTNCRCMIVVGELDLRLN